MKPSLSLGLLVCVGLLSPVGGCAKPKAPPAVVDVVAPQVDRLGPIPTAGVEVAFTLPIPIETKLSNGVSVWTIPNGTLPIVTVDIVVPGGTALDPVGKEGTAALAATLMTKGAGKRDATAFAEEVERLGVELESSVDTESAHVTLSCNRDVLSAALDLAADAILRPSFTAGDFAREQDLALADLESSYDEPAWLAERTAMSLWFGLAHPYGRPDDGTLAGLKKTVNTDVKAWWKRAWNASAATVTLSGAITAEDATSLLEARLGAWKATTSGLVAVPPAPAHADAPYYLVDKPGSAQTAFYIAFPGVAFGDMHGAPLRTGAIALGGTFTSRLNHLLREVRGYTYGVKAGLVEFHHGGISVVRSRIRTDVTAPALTDLLAEFERAHAGIDDAESLKARGSYRQDVVQEMETRAGTTSTFSAYHAEGMPISALSADMAAMRAVTTADVTPALAAFDRKKAVVVLVGDRAVIEPALRAAGYANIEVVTAP